MSDDEDQVEAPAKPKLVKRRSLRLDEKQDVSSGYMSQFFSHNTFHVEFLEIRVIGWR